MRLALFGSSGRTGRLLVTEGLARGHEIVTLVRNPTRLDRAGDGLRYIHGDVMDAQDVSRTIAGSAAVINALGHTATSTSDVLTVSTRHILDAMHTHGVSRLVALSCATVPERDDRPDPLARITRWMVRLVLRPDRRDALRSYRLICASDVQWTVIRPLLINERPPSGQVRAGRLGEGVGRTITRQDLAWFLLDQVAGDTFLRKAPAVSN